MANIVLRNGWNQPATYKNVASVTFQTDVEGVTATYYENGSGGSGGLGAQANWLQNDNQAADYIKNRPFYSDYTVILPPQSVEFIEEAYEGKSLYGAVIGELENLSEAKYTIIWGDDLWFCDVVEREGKKYIGDLNIIGIQVENNNVLEQPPFLGVCEDGLLTFYSVVPEALSVGLGGPEIIHKINSKYLPEGMMGNADWNAKPGDPGYIANKPTTLGLDEEALAKYLVDNKYATEEYVTKALTDFEKKIPSVEEFITEDEVVQKIKEATDGINKTLEEYAKSSWVSDNFASKDDLQGVANRVKTIEENYINKTTFKTLEDTVTALQKALTDYKAEVEKTYATKTELANSQADWSVEDEASPAAIKNKPFGDIPDIAVLEDASFIYNSTTGMYEIDFNLKTPLDGSMEYKLVWNGENYLFYPDAPSSFFTLTSQGVLYTSQEQTSPSLLVIQYADNVYRLDTKYLKREEILEGMASEEYVTEQIKEIGQADWLETNKDAHSYIKNKPTIPDAPVQSDWNATSGLAYIKNKPTIPAAQIQSNWTETNTNSKAYIKNKPTIPAAQIQSDWEQTDSNKVDFIKNKPTIPAAQVQVNWGQEDPNKIDFIQNRPSYFSDWNAKEGRSSIINMPEAFRHSNDVENTEEVLLDTPQGWTKKAISKLTMTVTFEDDSVKIYSMVGEEVVE